MRPGEDSVGGGRRHLDYLLIDTHPGLNEETLLSITLTDVLLVVLRPDSQDDQGTSVTVEVARTLDVPRLLLLINKVLLASDSAALAPEGGADLLRGGGRHPAARGRGGPLGEQRGFLHAQPEHAWTREVERVAARVMA